MVGRVGTAMGEISSWDRCPADSGGGVSSWDRCSAGSGGGVSAWSRCSAGSGGGVSSDSARAADATSRPQPTIKMANEDRNNNTPSLAGDYLARILPRQFSVGSKRRQDVQIWTPEESPPGVTHQTLEQEHRMSTKGSIFPVVPSMQFQSQMSCSQSESGPGDHLFKARSGFAQTKAADEANFGLVATQTIIAVYCRPKSGLTLDVLSNVVRQFCSHTAGVVEQVSNPLASAQFFAQAWANVSVVPVVPPAAEAPPVALVPPVAEAPPLPPVAEVAPPPPVAEAPPLPPVEEGTPGPALSLLPQELT